MANETAKNLNIGNLENEALKRKERLKALKRGDLKTFASEDAVSDNASVFLESFPKPIFRNYTPKDEVLKLQKKIILKNVYLII